MARPSRYSADFRVRAIAWSPKLIATAFPAPTRTNSEQHKHAHREDLRCFPTPRPMSEGRPNRGSLLLAETRQDARWGASAGTQGRPMTEVANFRDVRAKARAIDPHGTATTGYRDVSRCARKCSPPSAASSWLRSASGSARPKSSWPRRRACHRLGSARSRTATW
jgi:hypothetical protein